MSDVQSISKICVCVCVFLVVVRTCMVNEMQAE
jgi:hypothetical protein